MDDNNKGNDPIDIPEQSVLRQEILDETNKLSVDTLDKGQDQTSPVSPLIVESMAMDSVGVPSKLDSNLSKGCIQKILCKDNPTDIEMDLAEDSTQRAHSVKIEKQEKTLSYQESVAREQAVESHAVIQIANSSLSLLSQYISSDSDSNITDSEEELPKITAQTIKQESESDSGEECVEVIHNTSNYRTNQSAIVISDTETAPDVTDHESDNDLFSSEEEDETAPAVPVKAKGETLIHELPPIEELQISVSEEQCKSIGHIQSIVAQIVIVQSMAGVELLNIDTVLFLEKGKRSLGKIFDVIGQVAAPMYCVLFNSRQEVIDKGIHIGSPVYCAPRTEHTQFIILSDLMKQRGSDASWLDDGETPEYALDFSDDEQERVARKHRHNSNSSTGRQTPDGNPRPPFYRRGRGRGFHRGRPYSHSWHYNISRQNQPLRVLNPFSIASNSSRISSQPPPPPPSAQN
ncbi:H/ACA ribonucleoprotein complex non-core subunit NAF1 [Malaya genurostris]|uniref:H/ACA ribonucleoprotein complex non-core subunit NAF1 n=1 Tax=Malaya genurostris TaxID=325434 RepID=UPI0026F3ED5A|nr:H/ACA ribonucleoprotein complex non-core subunit NAF1 [Malaya genurostris]XP_058467021.1 H/ACA ribonucleoprotein complex non-core subunit NAF1 [Malaya genurostris]